MSWIVYSLMAALIFSIVNTIDKFILNRIAKHPIIPIMILGGVGLFSAAVVFFVKGYSVLPLWLLILNLFGGICYILGNLFYFQAAKLEEISRVVPLLKLVPLCLLIPGVLFLGEVLTFQKYIGIFLLVSGAMLISLKGFKLQLNRSFWLMILSVVSFSIYLALTKYLLIDVDFWTVFSYNRIGGIFVLIPIYWLHFYKLKETIQENGWKGLAIISSSEALNVLAVLFVTLAASVGYITLVESMLSLQSLFLLIITVFLSVFFPRIIQEEVDKQVILMKLLAVSSMVLGAYFVS